MLGIVGASTSCSLIVDSNADQCTVDADCKGALLGRTCAKGLCVDKTVTGCTKNTECREAPFGPLFVCRKSACVSLTNELCTTIHTTKKVDADAINDDNALVIGSINPTVGDFADYGIVVEDAIKLAIDDFANTNGIPLATGTGTRPIVLVGCNDGPQEDRAVDAAKHLVNDLQVPAIIGYPGSGSTIDVATEVTNAAGVLLFSSAATSDGITKLADNDLVWRTSPPDSFQATALGLYYPTVESRAKKLFQDITGDVKVAIVYTSDSYGSGLADALQTKLTFNGKSALSQINTNFKRFDYGPPEAPDLATVAKVTAFAPHIIFIFGFTEAIDPMLTSIEQAWVAPADKHRPMWVFSDGALSATLLTMAITTEELRVRVSGSVPGVLTETYPPYASFLAQWSASPYSTGEANQLGTAGAYDILYMLAYSAVAVGAKPLTGTNMVKYGLRKMVPAMGATKVQIGPGNGAINDTFTKLTSGKLIDIEGTSGPLDFDEFGEAPSDIQIWCMATAPAPKLVGDPLNSGLHLDSKTNKLIGQTSSDCGFP
ncbi:MAG: ABC transporter substrate-binding protein [Minicystis sp.]